MTLVIFQNSFLLGLKVYFWPLIFISYQLMVVTILYILTIYCISELLFVILFLKIEKDAKMN
jgi:hypothetical protein